MKKENLVGKLEIVFIILLAVFVLALRLPRMFDPLNREEGMTAYTAAVIMDKGLPYRDVFDSNPPVVNYLYSAAFEMGGKTPEAIRGFTIIYLIFSMILVYMFARTFGKASAAMMASLFYMIFFNSSYMYGFASSAGVFTHFTIIFALYFMLDRDKTYESVNFFLTGFLLATALFTDITVMAVFFVPLIYIVTQVKGKKRSLGVVLWYTSGFICMTGLAVLWSVKNSIFGAFFDAVAVYNFKALILFLQTRPQGAVLSGAGAFAAANLFLSAAFIYSLAGLFNKKNDHVNFVLVLTVLAVMTGVMLFKGTEPHDYSMLIPYLSMMAAFMIKNGLQASAALGKRGVIAVMVIVIISALEIAFGFFVTPKSTAEENMTLRQEAYAMSARINSSGNKKPSLFVWPNDPEIYFYAKIRAGQRIINSEYYKVNREGFGPMAEGVCASRPDYMILERGSAEKIFENLVKTHYIKSLEGQKLVLYKKGGM